MNILILGKGVIGTIYGYVFSKSGNTVKHLIRQTSIESTPKEWHITGLDGRYNNVKEINDTYHMKLAEKEEIFDLVFISVPNKQLASAIHTLDEHNIDAPLLIFSGIWEERQWLDDLVGTREYVLGYPVADGRIDGNHLSCEIFDHVQLEGKLKATISIYDQITSMFKNADLKMDIPFDMLEWLWIHNAINAGVGVTIGAHATTGDISSATKNVLSHTSILTKTIRSIRETLKVVKKRGVKLNSFWEDISLYYFPVWIMAPLMKSMFHKRLLSREIMTMNQHIEDSANLIELVYHTGKELNVSMPFFSQQYDQFSKNIERIQKND